MAMTSAERMAKHRAKAAAEKRKCLNAIVKRETMDELKRIKYVLNCDSIGEAIDHLVKSHLEKAK